MVDPETIEAAGRIRHASMDGNEAFAEAIQAEIDRVVWDTVGLCLDKVSDYAPMTQSAILFRIEGEFPELARHEARMKECGK